MLSSDHCLLTLLAAENATMLQAGACSSSPQASASGSEQLWVDKYSPKSFLELLSNEQINREVICWLKSWDRCVFGRQAAPRQSDRKGKVKAPPMPEHRILLLGGAPGAAASGISERLAYFHALRAARVCD